MDKNLSKEKIIRVHNLSKGDKIHCYVTTRLKRAKDIVTFQHVDGRYSYCTTESGEVVHLAVMTPLKKVDEHYEIIYEDV